MLDMDSGLRVCGGSAALYRRLLGKFQTNTLHGDFQAALAQGDVSAAQSAAHALKGVTANLGLCGLNALITAAEQKLKSGVLPPDGEAIADAYAETQAEIENILAN
jgi:HPt (histidine-containing phosphotransfer) domain-containing protein